MEKLDKVIAGVEHCADKNCGCEGCPYYADTDCENSLRKDVLECLRNMEPVVHAHWDDGRCSHCDSYFSVTVDGEDITLYDLTVNRCPECGAHMDEEVTHG